MRNLFITFVVFSVAINLCAQTETNPFAKYGLKKVMMATFSKGEFEEFHKNKEIVEIGSVLYDTKTKEVIGYIDENIENDVTSATPAMSIDPLCEKYPWITPYAYCANNPINAIDPDGRDSYLLTWFSKDGETGHAGIAVDNYKRQEIKDSKGNPVLDKKGNPTYEMVKDGTMTYYDLWPNKPVGKTELQSDVKSDYSKGVKINSLSDLTTKDPTGSRSGSVSAEGRAADGIVQIGTTYDQDTKIQGYASRTANSGKAYNASDFNCSTFAESALKTVFPTLDASQFVKIPGALRLIYNDTRVVAPNNLYNATMGLPGATNIRGPKSVVAKPYLQYYGK